MAKDIKSYERFINGIADYEAEGVEDSFSFARNIDHRTDPTSFKLLPKTIKESGTVVTDFVKWAETVSGISYMIGVLAIFTAVLPQVLTLNLGLLPIIPATDFPILP